MWLPVLLWVESLSSVCDLASLPVGIPDLPTPPSLPLHKAQGLTFFFPFKAFTSHFNWTFLSPWLWLWTQLPCACLFLDLFDLAILLTLHCCCSVIQPCLILCNPMDCSMPGFPVLHHLLEIAQTHVHCVGDTIQPSHPLSSPSLSIFPSIRVFSNELALPIRWPKYWSFSFIISPSNGYSGLISFRIDWFDLLAVQGTLNSSPTPQFKIINSSVLSLLYGSIPYSGNIS